MSVHEIFYMDKEELHAYAVDNFHIEIDKNLSREEVIEKIVILIEDDSASYGEPRCKIIRPPSTHILNKDTGQIFPYRYELEVYLKNFMLCDINGNPV